MADEPLYLPSGAFMNIVFWTVVILLLVVHVLRHVVIRKESKLVFWLSVAFAVAFVSSVTILFDHYYGDWSQVKLLFMVIAYAVVDQLFMMMVWQIEDNLSEAKIEVAVDVYGARRAEEIVDARDRQAFQNLLYEELEVRAEEKARALIDSRDTEEFNRLRQAQLSETVKLDFEERLQAAIEAGARAEVAEQLQEEAKKARQGGKDRALWVALQGTSKAVADAFGLETPQDNKVFAVPYWVYYDPVDHKPHAIRCNSTKAYLIDADQVSFVSKRWSKVEGINQIVLDCAIISRPS